MNPPLKRIGAGALEYDFGALDDADNPLTKSYLDIMYDCQYSPPATQGSCRVNRLLYFPGLRPSGTAPDPSSSSLLSRNGSQD